MSVDHRGLDTGMARQHQNGAQMGAAFEQKRDNTVAPAKQADLLLIPAFPQWTSTESKAGHDV